MNTEQEELIRLLKRKTYEEMYQIVLYGDLPLDFNQFGWSEDEWVQEHGKRKSDSLKKLINVLIKEDTKDSKTHQKFQETTRKE